MGWVRFDHRQVLDVCVQRCFAPDPAYHGLQWLLNHPPRVCAFCPVIFFLFGMNQKGRKDRDVFWTLRHNASADG